VKYLFKYIYKGHDRVSVALDEADSNGNIDEIKQFRDARWVTPPEALWRIYSFDLSEISPSVRQLQLHLPDMHMVSFNAGEDLHDVVARQLCLEDNVLHDQLHDRSHYMAWLKLRKPAGMHLHLFCSVCM
jgi:hypothetical protein